MTQQSCLRCHEECDRSFCEFFETRDGTDGSPGCRMQVEARRMRRNGWPPGVISAILGIRLEVVLRWIS